eukprot:638875-Prorocentrum_minimum.AAC.1
MASAVSVGAGAATLSSSVCGCTEKLMSTVACDDGCATRPRDITVSAEHRQRTFQHRSRSRSCFSAQLGSNNKRQLWHFFGVRKYSGGELRHSPVAFSSGGVA